MCSTSYSVSKSSPNKSCIPLRKSMSLEISQREESTGLLQVHLFLAFFSGFSILGGKNSLPSGCLSTITSMDQLCWSRGGPWGLERQQSSKCKGARTQKGTSVLLQHFSIRALRDSQRVKRGSGESSWSCVCTDKHIALTKTLFQKVCPVSRTKLLASFLQKLLCRLLELSTLLCSVCFYRSILQTTRTVRIFMLKFTNYPLVIAVFIPITFMAIGLIPLVKFEDLYQQDLSWVPFHWTSP